MPSYAPNKIKKRTIVNNTIEQLKDLAVDTAKGSVGAIKDVSSPSSFFESLLGFDKPKDNSDQQKDLMEQLKNKGEKHTPLDFDKLNGKYQNNDKMKLESLRRHLFSLVKREDEKVQVNKQHAVAEQQRQQEYNNQQMMAQKQREQNQQGGGTPQGKIRRSVLGGKKAKTGGMNIGTKYESGASKGK
ncbi:MAG: hypothetical protein WCO06_02325 [Candidatus Roizmanbacteria bacterium]